MTNDEKIAYLERNFEADVLQALFDGKAGIVNFSRYLNTRKQYEQQRIQYDRHTTTQTSN